MASTAQHQTYNPDDGAALYSSIGAKYEVAFGHDEGLLAFLQEVLAQLPAKATVLDAGCGTGRPVAATLAQNGHQVIGIDISDVMVGLSQQVVPSGKFEIADMREYKPPEIVKLDVVLNILSLFLLRREEIEAMAGRWSSWLHTGGLLCICSIAAEDCEPEKRAKGYDSDGLCARGVTFQFMGEAVYVTLFTREGWKGLLEKNGFEILSTKTVLHVPPPEAQSDEEHHLFIIAKKVQ